MKDLIFKLWSSKKIRYTVIIGFASLVAYLLGKQILKYYGVKPSKKDKRDYKISGVSADSVFPSKYCLPLPVIKNQERTNSCCAHSMAYVSESVFKKSGDPIKDRFSVGFVYGYRPQGYYTGEGMYPREALKTIKELGMVRHSDFPYNEEVPKMTQMVMADLDNLKTKASPNKSAAYFQITNEDEMKTCIMNYGPVSIMYPVTDEFEAPVDGRIEVKGLKNFVGYHQVTIYGWEGPFWKMINSWGEGWGNKGTALVSFKYPWNEAWGFSTDPLAAIKRKTFISKIRFWFINLF